MDIVRRGGGERPVHVRELDLVVVEEDELADAAAGEHLRDDAADAAEADDGDGEGADFLSGSAGGREGVTS
jgi:hypothetical protein